MSGSGAPPAAVPAKPHHSGHRDRLRTRFMAGADALPDYELLELLLFQAILRRDTKPLAKALIDRFGSLAAVFAAPPQALAEILKGHRQAVVLIKAIQAAATRMLREDVVGQPLLGSWQALLDYCAISMAHDAVEQFRVLFLDTRNHLIADEVQQRGTVNQTAAYPREVVKRALDLAASAVILVHNHPSGDPTPSRADIDMTRAIATAAAPLGIAIHDHIVIGRGRHVSFKAQGLL